MREVLRTLWVLAAALTLAAQAGLAEEWTGVRLTGEATRRAMTEALERAAQRLRDPACAAVLGEFRATNGRTLQDNLSALGLDPPGYLRTVLFYDGLLNGRCAKKSVFAATMPNSRVVLVCHRFYKRWLFEPEWAEAVVIHEALHTLGLGENPPSSQEITGRVLDRCMNDRVAVSHTSQTGGAAVARTKPAAGSTLVKPAEE